MSPIHNPTPTELVPQTNAAGVELAALWTLLMTTRYRVASWGHNDTYCYIVLGRKRSDVNPERLLSDFDIAQRLLLGEPQKSVAIDKQLASSTVACAFSRCMRSMGMNVRVHAVPMLVAMAANAASHSTTVATTQRFRVYRHGDGYWLLESPRPDSTVDSLFPKEQAAVLHMMLEGKTQREIAALRGRSVRTIANQIGQAYNRLGVSRRNEFLAWLLHRAPKPQAPSLERPFCTIPPALTRREPVLRQARVRGPQSNRLPPQLAAAP